MTSIIVAQSNQESTGGLVMNPSSAIVGQSSPSRQVCEARRNDTGEKLLECTQADDLWKHLSDIQKISDQNPGSDGHGNRDTRQRVNRMRERT